MAKRVLVTGGARRLGAQLCETFWSAGWEVWCHHHRSADAAQALRERAAQQGARVHLVQADLHDRAQLRNMMAHIAQQGGPVHALINNASLFEPDEAHSMDVDRAQAQMEVNLLAPLMLSSVMAQEVAALPQADAVSGERCIIHVLDQKVFNLNPDYFSYTVTKLALERAVALQAQALAPAVRVCGVAPGLMFPSGPQTAHNFERAGSVNLMRRPTDPAQVAASCLFLAQNPCITGVTLAVDNGQHLVPLARDVMFIAEDLIEGHDVR